MDLVLFLGVLIVLQGCAQKKTYSMYTRGDKTARLTVPNFIEINNLDGDSVEGLFSRIIHEGQKELVFPAGTHTVEMRYNDLWDIDDDDHENIISKYIILQFKAKPGSVYKIVVKEPEDRESAWELATHFNAAIIDVTTRKKVSHLAEAP